MSDLRCKASLPVTVSLAEERSGAQAEAVLAGRTRDMRATGLSLILPALRLGDQDLSDEKCRLRVRLELPAGPILMEAAAVRHERLEEEGEAYLIGVRITELSDEDCLRFVKYLRTLH